MRIFFGLALLSLTASMPAQANEAAVCNTYLLLENQLRCPASGYLMATGYILCREYAEVDYEFSLSGRVTMAKIRRCLTGALLQRSRQLTCQNAADIGYASHVGCYVSSGFCSLSLHDKAVVFMHAGRTLLDGKAWKQFPAIEKACSEN